LPNRFRIILIETHGIRGQPYSLYNRNDSSRNYSALSSGYNRDGYFELIVGDKLEANRGCFITFDTVGKWNYKLDEASTIEVIDYDNGVTVMVRAGRILVGADIQASKLITYASYGVDETKVENWVAELRKDPRFNDRSKNEALVTEIISRKMNKQSFISGISTFLPNYLSVPADLANKLIQWCNQAEMAYAIACVYASVPPAKRTPDTVTNFKNDLTFLFAGEAMTRAAIGDLNSRDITGAQRTAVTNAIGTYRMTEVIPRDVLEKFTATTVQRLVQQDSSFLQTALGFVPVVNLFSAVYYSSSEAQQFGARARKYYQR
jgi:hypothetical protein